MPSIGVALTWLNSSSGVSLVMSLIPKTSHAPFTASHTKLNTKSKTQTLGRRSVRKRLEKVFRSRAKGVWRCSHVAPQSCPSVPPIFDVGSPGRKTKKQTFITKRACHCSTAFAPPISCLNSLKTTERGKGTPTPKSDLPDNKPTTAVKTIPKIPINGY